MPRIAIVGSCITRDLWPIRGGAAERLLYVSRTSLPSLFSPPVAGFQPADHPPGGLHRHQHNALVADLQKTAIGQLVAFQPTHLIFDFIDERFDLLSIGPALATRSAELEMSGYLRQPAFHEVRTIARLSAACERLWEEAAREMAALVRATPLARARLILHSARWATEQRDPTGQVSPLQDVWVLGDRPAEIAAYNAQLSAYEAIFQSVMPPMTRVDASDRRLADPAHRWGLSAFHYIPEYYAEIRRQLDALGLEEAFTARPAAPSVPVA
jgi:hypothetical protein